MRRLTIAVSAAIAAIAILVTGTQIVQPVKAAVNLAVHVHDDYYHPAGYFTNPGPGTNHPLAQTFCQAANPAFTCDAQIGVGDTITWVSPSPFATNPHSVTECTDNTFSVCGAGVSAQNPINDSGILSPPMPGPSGWPYGPITFSTVGTYYYRCEVHPATMRGRIVVSSSVGGTVDIIGSGFDGDSSTTWVLGAAAALVLLAGTGGVLATQRIRRRKETD